MKIAKFSNITAAMLALFVSISMTSCDDDDDNPSTPGLTCTPEEVVMETGSTATVTVSGGTAPFTLVSSDDEVAAAIADADNENDILVTGLKEGTATIYITDANGLNGSVSAIIKDKTADLDFDKNSVSLTVGSEESVSVAGGNAPYTATVSDDNIATATVDGDIITVTGLASGSTTVTVTDSDDKTGTISVIVTEE